MDEEENKMLKIFVVTILVGFTIPCFVDENEKTVAIEKVREWDRVREATLNLTAEELKRRQQATEKVAAAEKDRGTVCVGANPKRKNSRLG